MKSIKQFLIIALIPFFFHSCEKDDSSAGYEYAKEYKKSLSKWEAFKVKSSNSYTYEIEIQRALDYPPMRIILTIENGVLTKRKGWKVDFYNNPRPETGWTKVNLVKILTSMNWKQNAIDELLTADYVANMDWEEDKNNLGEHLPKDEILTMDQIYQKAKEYWLIPENSDDKIIFETENNGMISIVGKASKPSYDGPFNGVIISSITRLY